MKETFSYLTNKRKEIKIGNQPFDLVMTRITSDIAALQFISSDPENNGEIIPVPPGVMLVDLESSEPSNPLNDYFFITWFANYSLRFNGTEILRFVNEKQQSVTGIARQDGTPALTLSHSSKGRYPPWLTYPFS